MELKEYLRTLFRPGDTVNFVVSSFEKNGKFLPSGKGANKSFEELIKACDTYEDIGYILAGGTIKKGEEVTATAGKATKAADGNYVIGVALSNAAENDYVRVQISKYQKNPAAK